MGIGAVWLHLSQWYQIWTESLCAFSYLCVVNLYSQSAGCFWFIELLLCSQNYYIDFKCPCGELLHCTTRNKEEENNCTEKWEIVAIGNSYHKKWILISSHGRIISRLLTFFCTTIFLLKFNIPRMILFYHKFKRIVLYSSHFTYHQDSQHPT